MERAGVRLKKLRLEKGLSLEEAHKKTKIHLNILKAIEEDNLVGLNPIYIKGFLKIYCKLLGTDPKDYVSGYQEPQAIVKEAAQPTEPAPFLEKRTLKLGYPGGLKIKRKHIVFILAVIFLFFALFSLGKIISSRRAASPRAKGLKSPARAQTVPLGRIQKEKKKAVSSAGAASEGIASKAISSGIRLSMRAKENCWVHLAVDGKVVFHAVLKKDKFESWQAKEKIEFSLGNAGAIELELNEKAIPPLGRRGQAIKNILITKGAGLVVGR